MNNNRRNFIKASASVTTALLLSSLDTFAITNNLQIKMDNKFELKILATNWGFKGNLDEYGAKVKKDGYDGVEMWWPATREAQEEMFTVLKKYNLEAGFLFGADEDNYTAHFNTFKNTIDAAANNKIQKPLYINCHSGADYFSYEENKSFIDYTTQLSKKAGLLIFHETHRSRMLFAAPVAKTFMEKNLDLQITFDVSHWCNVSESLLQNQKAALDLAIERTGHIHARIGHPQGPQVNDPRAPEWQSAVEAHFAWWDKIADLKKRKGERLTILTEFGPPDYMPTLPYTRQPLANQWAINVHMMQVLRKRYQA